MKNQNLYETGISDFLKEDIDFNYKIILVGNSEVGKTSISNKYVND